MTEIIEAYGFSEGEAATPASLNRVFSSHMLSKTGPDSISNHSSRKHHKQESCGRKTDQALQRQNGGLFFKLCFPQRLQLPLQPREGPLIDSTPSNFLEPLTVQTWGSRHLLGSPRLTGLYKRWACTHTVVDPPPEDLNCWTPGEDINVGSKEGWNPLLFLSPLFFSFLLFPLSFLF